MKKKTMAATAAFLLSFMLLVPFTMTPTYVKAAQACPLCHKTMDTIYIENTYAPEAEIHYDAYWYCYNCNIRDDYPYCTRDTHEVYMAGVSMQTCTEDGWYKAGCKKCGASELHITGYATGHIWTEWYEENQASCFAEGVYSRYCTECYVDDHYFTPKTPHEGGQWHLEYCASETGPGKMVQNCKYCGIELNVEWVDHTWGAWKLVTSATCTTPGKEVTECQYCSATDSRLVEALGHIPSGWIHAYYPADDENGYDYQICNRCGERCNSYVYPLDLADLNEIPQVLMPLAQELSPHDNLVQMNPLAQEEGTKELEMIDFHPDTGILCCHPVDGAEDYRIDLYKEEEEYQFVLVDSLVSESSLFSLMESLEAHGEGAYSAVVWARKGGHRISEMVPGAFVYLTQVPAIQDCQAEYTYAIWTPGRHLPDDVIYRVEIQVKGKTLATVYTRNYWLDMEPYGKVSFTLKITASAPFFESSAEYTSEELEITLPTYYRVEEEAAVYTLADPSSEKRGTLQKDEIIRVWEQQGDLYRLDFDGYESWAQCSSLTPASSKAGKKVKIDLGDSKAPLVLYTAYDGTVGELVLPQEILAEHPGEKIIGFSKKYGSFLVETIPVVDEDTTFYASWGKDPDQAAVTLILPSGDEQEVLYLPKGKPAYGLPTLYMDQEIIWLTEKKGMGIELRNGFLVPENADTITLYGICLTEEEMIESLRAERGLFTVTFDPGLGACEYAKAITLDAYRPDFYGSINLHQVPMAYSGEEGKVFTGWKCESEKFVQANGTVFVVPGQRVVILQDEVFTAVYEEMNE